MQQLPFSTTLLALSQAKQRTQDIAALLNCYGYGPVSAQPCLLTRQWHPLPALATIGGVQQDGGLAHDPPLVAIEGDGIEAEVEALVLQQRREWEPGNIRGNEGLPIAWMLA